MKLLNISLWKSRSQSMGGERESAAKADKAAAVTDDAPADNVIPLHARAEGTSGDRIQISDPWPASARTGIGAGPFRSPLVAAFFAENYFGLGRHNGAHFRTRDALDLGKAQLTARFQNVLAQLLIDSEARLARLRDKAVETAGICSTTTARLELACASVQREIDDLRSQLELTAAGKGWVLEALNRYQIGFTKGLHEALAFDLIAS